MGILHKCIQNTEYTKQIAATFIMILALKGQGSGKMQAQSCHPGNGGGRYTQYRGDGRNVPCAVTLSPRPHPLPWHLGPRRASFSAAGQESPFFTSSGGGAFPSRRTAACVRERIDLLLTPHAAKHKHALGRPRVGSGCCWGREKKVGG